MSDLISRHALVQEITKERDKIPLTVPCAPYELRESKPFQHGNSMRGGIRKALRCVEQAPAVDAEAVVRGEWIIFNNGQQEYPQRDHMKCSVCGWFWSDPAYRKTFIHCPSCGAKMGGNDG